MIKNHTYYVFTSFVLNIKIGTGALYFPHAGYRYWLLSVSIINTVFDMPYDIYSNLLQQFVVFCCVLLKSGHNEITLILIWLNLCGGKS